MISFLTRRSRPLQNIRDAVGKAGELYHKGKERGKKVLVGTKRGEGRSRCVQKYAPKEKGGVGGRRRLGLWYLE